MSRLLLIDDDNALRTVLRQGLERAGHEILEAVNGRDALNVLVDHQVDTIITDIVMPDMEGIEFIQSLRKTHPTLPVIAISGGGLSGWPDGYLKLARALGAARVLAKPFELEELLEMVRDVAH